MARNRMIKPEFWEDEKVGSLSISARLLFIGMWNIADDEGLLRFNSAYLKSSIFIYDELGLDVIQSYMNEIIEKDLICVYSEGITNQKYAYIINFRKHQKIDRPQPSKLPAPSIQNPSIKEMYFRRDGYICHLCHSACKKEDGSKNCHSSYPSLDHIIPRIKGGNDYPSNIKTACISCNKGRCDDDIPNNSSSNSSSNSSPKLSKDKLKEVKLSKDKREGEGALRPHPPAVFIKPTREEVKTYCVERKNFVDSDKLYDYYEANGWKVGKNPMKDWRAAVRNWERGDNAGNRQNLPPAAPKAVKVEDKGVPMSKETKEALENFKIGALA